MSLAVVRCPECLGSSQVEACAVGLIGPVPALHDRI